MDCLPDLPRTVYRIADGRFPLFDGTGAGLHGGRWNSPGHSIIYASDSYAGAMLEVLVRAGIGRVPQRFAWIGIRLPVGASIEWLTAAALPGWDADDLIASRRLGDQWLSQRRSVVLMVPSVVTRLEHNVLINPSHPDFELLRASHPEPAVWDQRLFAASYTSRDEC